MGTRLNQSFIQSDFTTGLIDDVSVSKSLFPRNAVRKALNVQFHRPRGGISQRNGYTKIATVEASSILGLHNYRSSNANNHKLLAAAGTSLYRLNGAAWTETATGFTAGQRTRFLTYLDTVVVLNGTNAARSSGDGAAFVVAGGNLDVANFPLSSFATVLNTRVLSAKEGADTFYESSLESSGTISWTSGNRNTRVNPDDGAGGIKALAGNGRLALIFKQRGLYRYDGTELQRVGFVGTPSHESVVTDDSGLTYFFGQGSNAVGFYVTDGGRPVKISRAVTKYVEAVSASGYGDVAAYTDGTVVEWAVGAITIDAVTYSNASLVYCIPDRSWTVFDRADGFRVFSQYIDGDSDVTVVGGDSDGDVHTIDSGDSDNGTVIASLVDLAPVVFTSRGRTKTIPSIVSYAEAFNGLNLYMATDSDNFKYIDGIKSKTQLHDDFKIPNPLSGNEFFPRIAAVNDGTPWEFSGLEYVDVIDEGYRNGLSL